MSPISLTLLGLALLAVSLLALRSSWPRLRRSTRRLILSLATLAVSLLVWGYVTHWVTISPRVNSAIYWGSVAGYLLLLTIHTLTPPRWLNGTTAGVLALPLLSSSLLLPLTLVFEPVNKHVQPLGHHLFATWIPFTDGNANGTGVDIDISYRPPLLPFMRHSRLGGRFYDSYCNSHATEVRLEPDLRSVYIRCPLWPGSTGKDTGNIIRLH